MRKKLLWTAAVVALVATPAVVGVLALGGDDNRRSGALIQPGTGGYELKIANLPPSGEALQIQSYSWGGSASASIASGVSRSTAPTSSELTVAKKVDSASPLLLKGLVSGTRYPTATLTLYKGGEGPEKYLEYKMTDVIISSVEHEGSADDVPTEQISFAFAKIETEVEDKEGGKVQATNTYLWNVSALKQ